VDDLEITFDWEPVGNFYADYLDGLVARLNGGGEKTAQRGNSGLHGGFAGSGEVGDGAER